MALSGIHALHRSIWWAVGAPVLLIAISVGAQMSRLASSGFWVDEAESTINALTILEHGYPTDSYLGIPIFENMLVEPWPEHPEYEFKDVSYSDRGMAVYHGWLPLYAIAGSLKLFGIEPATPSTSWQIDIDLDRYRRITLAARAPSVLFFAALLALIFFAGKGLANQGAAMAVLALVSLSWSIVGPTISARYYAPMLALSALGALTLWRVVERGRVADYAAHTAVLVALFYSHLIVFATLVLLTVLMLALYQRTASTARRLTASLFVVAACCAPWLLATGYLQHLGKMPSGFSMVRLPGDLLHYLFNRLRYLLLFSAGGIWLALAWIRHGAALPSRLREPWLQHRKQYSMLLLWMLIATAIYYVASPPASLFPQRLSLSLYVPGFLFMAMSMADASRTISRSLSFLMTPALALLFLVVGGSIHIPHPEERAFEKLGETFEMINSLGLEPDAKVYASPASHLILTVYSGKPIQSVAPVRKSFFDSYPGEILYIEQQYAWEFSAPAYEGFEDAGIRQGVVQSPAEIEAARLSLVTRFARERTAPRVAEVIPPLEPLPPVWEEAMQGARDWAKEAALEQDMSWQYKSLPFFRGFRIRTAADFWQNFFYRLVDPASRRGGKMNAAERLRLGKAYFLPSMCQVFFYSPKPAEPASGQPTAP